MTTAPEPPEQVDRHAPVRLLAPFRLHGDPRLEHVLVADLAAVREALDAAAPAWQGRAPDAVHSSGVLIQDHEVRDGTLLPLTLWRGRLRARHVLPHLVRSVTAVVGPHGVGALVLCLELAPSEHLDAVEEELTAALAPLVRDLARGVSDRLLALGLLSADPGGLRQLPQGRALWWHRLLDPRLHQATERSCQLEGAGAAVLRDGVHLQVADGYSCLSGGDEQDRTHVVQGLLQATELWLTADRLQRRLTERTAELLRNETDGLVALQADALRLSETSELQGQLLSEQFRYTTGAALLALETAAAVWRTPPDLGPLIARAAQVEAAVARRIEEQRAEQERRSGRLLAAITVISGLAVLLSVFETAFGEPLGTADTVRLAFASLVLLASGVVVGKAIAQSRARARRGN